MAFGQRSRPILLCSASADYIIVWDIEQCQRKTQEGQKIVCMSQHCFHCLMYSLWTCVEHTGSCTCINLTLCLQVKSQLARLLGRCWVKLSTCRSALLMSEWPRAPERLYMFSAQRQETTQISIACPTNVNICGTLDRTFRCHPVNIFNSLWLRIFFFFQHKTHQVISTMSSHLGPLTSAEFCPWNEDVLVTISEDRTFKVRC